MLSTRFRCAAAIVFLFHLEVSALEEKSAEPSPIANGEAAVRHTPLTPLMRHILFFAKKNNLSYEGMMAAHKELGFKENLRLKIKIGAILNLAKKGTGKNEDELLGEVSRFAQWLERAYNPASARIWQPGGQIDYSVLDAISEKAVMLDGKLVITKEIIEDHLKDVQSCSNGAKSVAVWVGLIPITWAMVTSGSFGELFKYLGDIEGRPDAISVKRFREFYEASDEVLGTLLDVERES